MFNKFDALDDLDQFDGAIANMLVSQDLVVARKLIGEEKNKYIHAQSQEGIDVKMDTDIRLESLGEMRTSRCKKIKDGSSITSPMAHVEKDSHLGRKSKSTPPILGVHQNILKKGALEKPFKVGRKKNQEKVKLVGETLVKYGSVKLFDSHFPSSQN